MARYYEETALIEFVKQYTPSIEGETTLECVERAIRNAPTADFVPKKDYFLIKENGEVVNLTARKEIANVLSDLKIAVHNKAYHTNTKDIPTYVTLKTFDAVVQDFINKYDGRK